MRRQFLTNGVIVKGPFFVGTLSEASTETGVSNSQEKSMADTWTRLCLVLNPLFLSGRGRSCGNDNIANPFICGFFGGDSERRQLESRHKIVLLYRDVSRGRLADDIFLG